MARQKSASWARHGAARPGRTRTRRGVKILHSCGHGQLHHLKGPAWKRTREREFLAGRPCTTCWAESQAEEMELLCGVPDLPEMVGTVAQILWARSIRGRSLSLIRAEAARLDLTRRQKNLGTVSDQFLALAVPAALKKNKAKWWIDRRDELGPVDLFLGKRELKKIQALRNETERAPPAPKTDYPEDPTCPF